jgi:hypothetical protein
MKGTRDIQGASRLTVPSLAAFLRPGWSVAEASRESSESWPTQVAELTIAPFRLDRPPRQDKPTNCYRFGISSARYACVRVWGEGALNQLLLVSTTVERA